MEKNIEGIIYQPDGEPEQDAVECSALVSGAELSGVQPIGRVDAGGDRAVVLVIQSVDDLASLDPVQLGQDVIAALQAL